MTAVGSGHRRLEGRQKVTGTAAYVADIGEPRLAHVSLLLSPHAHAEIEAVDVAAARSASGVIAVVTGKDLPLVSVPEHDLPLARDRVIYAGQPVVAVVAETREAAVDAAQLITIAWKELPPVLDPLAAMQPGAASVLRQSAGTTADAGGHGAVVAEAAVEDKPANVTAVTRVNFGDADQALSTADHVVEGRYEMPAVHQGFLEPHAAGARVEPDGRITVWASTQGMFLSRSRVAEILGLPLTSIRVVPLTVGGGFGGKIVLLEPLVALLAQITRRPVLLELTRTEEFLMGRGAPAAIIDLKLGADRSGHLVALRARAYYDNGAGPGVLGGFTPAHLAGAYRLPAFDYVGYDIATHKTPQAAYRAPGATQAFFALESAMDDLARSLAMDPVELRLQNAVREGDPRVNGGRWPNVGLREVLERTQTHPLYTAATGTDEGVGVAVGAWAGGLEPAAAACKVEPDGALVVEVGSVDISGTDTTLAMVAADTFGVAIDRVRMEKPDTASAPYAGMAGGSKIIYTVVPAVIEAVIAARTQILEIAADQLEANAEDLLIEDGMVRVKGVPSRQMAVGDIARLGAQFGGRYPPVHGYGRAAMKEQSPMFTVHIARVKLDRETGAYEVTGYAAIQDVGRALNPPEVVGQIHGGTLQGLGRVFGEDLKYSDEGRLRSASFLDYAMPTVDQAPSIETVLVEVPSPAHPLGARGVGEPPAIPPTAAVANAIRGAGGPRLTRLPITPQEMLNALRGEGAVAR